jgi:RNase H-fold protein (predicted Holliday junction resolvase)
MIVAIDPGREKCGLAAMRSDGSCAWHRVVPRSEILVEVERLARDEVIETWIVGSGTGSHDLVTDLVGRFGAERVVVVDERDSTLEARGLYFEENPPRGLWRLIPRGLLCPPGAIDDYAAIVLGRRYLGGLQGRA